LNYFSIKKGLYVQATVDLETSGCGAHPPSYPMGSGGSFPGDKVAGT